MVTAKAIELEKVSVTWEIIELLVSTLDADDNYPLLKGENLMVPMEMQLAQKGKTFCHFFLAFLRSTLNVEHFEGKDDPHRICICEITDSENVVR